MDGLGVARKVVGRTEVIVSLTSYPGRIGCVHKALRSLLNQIIRPDRIVLCLARVEFPGGLAELPRELAETLGRGVELLWADENLGPHKKYFYVMQKYPQAVVITVDDDKVYPPELVGELLASYRRHPNCVSAMRAHHMIFDLDGRIRPYREWFNTCKLFTRPSMCLMAIGAGGILYPPGSLPKDGFDKDAIMATSPRADDLWLKAMEVVNNIQVVLANDGGDRATTIEGTQEDALCKLNQGKGENDIALSKIASYLKRTRGIDILDNAFQWFSAAFAPESMRLMADYCRLARELQKERERARRAEPFGVKADLREIVRLLVDCAKRCCRKVLKINLRVVWRRLAFSLGSLLRRESSSESAEPLIRHGICLSGGGRPLAELEAFRPYGVDLGTRSSWSCVDIADSGKCWGVNSFFFIDNIIRDRMFLKDSVVAEMVERYVLSWTISNPVPRMDGSWPWNDDTTGRRVQRFSYLYRFASDAWQESTKAFVKRSLDAQADLLMSESFYQKKHNHGMYQDFALVCYALLVCEDSRRRDRMLRTAMLRVAAYWEFAFAKDGVHKEHSPSYAYEAEEIAGVFADLLRDYNPVFSKLAKGYSLRAKRFLQQMVLPDGRVPSIGDSDPSYRGLPSSGDMFPDVVFPHGGYAFFRSSPDDAPENATWVLFQAASHSSVHKHGDDLSFVLYHGGDLFVEAGKRNYIYDDPLTGYAYSGYAHNVMCVDDREFPVKFSTSGYRSILAPALKTRLVKHSSGTEESSATGVQMRFPGIVQQRTLSYNREQGSVRIVDEIQSSRAFKGTFLFHVAEGLRVVQREAVVEIYRAERLIARMSFADRTDSIFVSAGSGGGTAPYLTWLFHGNPEPRAGSLIGVNVKFPAGNGAFETFVQLMKL